jgi:magnesium transporter
MAPHFKHYHPPGTPPGTLTRQRRQEIPSQIVLVDYDGKRIEEIPDASPEQCEHYLARPSTTWIHVSGHPEVKQLQELGRRLNLHPLALEDVLNTVQRPKIEVFDEQLFVITNLPSHQNGRLRSEQISLFLMGSGMVSFHDGASGIFEPIWKRLQGGASLLRKGSADALLYAVLDLVIDHGFPVLESIGEQLEQLEDDILKSPDKHCLDTLHGVRRELVALRRMLWPQREILSHLMAEDDELIGEPIKVYLRDCYDHTVQIMDLIESYRDTAASLLDVYLSGVSNRLNETMRVLTVIATIFIPPTFLASIYGMNFERSAGAWSMPELGWAYGYPLAWCAMLCTMVAMLVYFKRKNWF